MHLHAQVFPCIWRQRIIEDPGTRLCIICACLLLHVNKRKSCSLNMPYVVIACWFYIELVIKRLFCSHSAIYSDNCTFSCCLRCFYFPFVGLELSKRHASARMEHRYVTGKVLSHVDGTVNA